MPQLQVTTATHAKSVMHRFTMNIRMRPNVLGHQVYGTLHGHHLTAAGASIVGRVACLHVSLQLLQR
jgi:hypothetical protein